VSVPTGPYIPCGSSDSSAGLTSPSPGAGAAYFETAARMTADVADALEHAHKQGIIHRDIKPSNLLLSADGRLSVNDFGLARVLEQPGMTLTGEFVGTPAYMSPEQITAGRVPADHRTDIYSLGATLYELLTLQPPFPGLSRDQLLAQILRKDPPRPCRLNPNVPRDLETICLKCLEKDPDRRYQTAKDLADDLRRYVNHFAIRARPTGSLGKLKKWVKRNPALAAAALVMLLAVGGAGYFARHAYKNDQRAQGEAKKRDQEVREQKQRAAIDRGMVAAMAADLPAARAASADAEALGASAGELRLLRGFVALYSDDPSDALGQFRAAAEAMPESVAARALLAVAFGRAEDWAARERVLKEAERLPVRTPNDRLFLGLALSPFDTAAGRREMLAAVEEQPSNAGRVLLAEALWMHAARTGTVADAEAALEAARQVNWLLPKNPYAETTTVYAHLAAAAAYELGKEPEKARAHLEAASGQADTLSGSPASPAVIDARYYVAVYRDGVTPPLRFTRLLRYPPRIKNPVAAVTEVAVHWRLGELEKARALLSALPPMDYVSEFKVALALEQADGRPAAQAAWAAWAASSDRHNELMGMIPWLYLTGEPERVPVMAAKLRASGYRYRPLPAAEWESFLRFWEGKLSESEFLRSVATNRMFRSWGHTIVGMKRLGEGDRDGARDAFTEVYKARTFYQGEWEWCCAFLIRMNTDPEWPKAIPLKKKP
jgi:hypothetical protein